MPKQIKEKLNGGQATGRHDIWLLNEHWNGKEIFPAVRDTIRIQLEETPTSGYTWLLQNQPHGMQLFSAALIRRFSHCKVAVLLVQSWNCSSTIDSLGPGAN